MTTATTTPGPVASGDPRTLSRLYLARFGFALIWAVLLVAAGSSISPLTAVLLVLYPLFDVAAAVIDGRSSRAAGVAGGDVGLAVNIAVSTLAAAGVAATLASGVPSVLRVWGAWAVVAGVVQLVVAVRRRALGGQWPMIVSGGVSTVAGTSFVLQSFAATASLATVAGYALLGGVFFLVSALRLGRAAGWNRPDERRAA